MEFSERSFDVLAVNHFVMRPTRTRIDSLDETLPF